MTSYTFRMEVVTPLFLSGADQTQAELRAPSIKGALRFWFRAMMGGIVGAENTAAIFAKEAELFGSTGGASHVAILAHQRGNANITPWDQLVGSLQWPASLGQLDPRQGMSYLGFSLKATRDRGARTCILPDRSQFELTMIPRYPAASQSGIQTVLASLWLATTLGGFGSRSRRGFGALRVVHGPAEKEVPPFVFAGRSPQDVGEFLTNGLALTKVVFQRAAEGASSAAAAPSADFCVLSPHYSEIVLLSKQGRGWGSWQEALGEVGWRLSEYRKGIRPVKRREPFGLPIQGVSNVRNASPLMIKPIMLQPGSFCILLLSFKTAKVANSGVVSTFIGNMEKQYQGLKVVVP